MCPITLLSVLLIIKVTLHSQHIITLTTLLSRIRVDPTRSSKKPFVTSQPITLVSARVLTRNYKNLTLPRPVLRSLT